MVVLSWISTPLRIYCEARRIFFLSACPDTTNFMCTFWICHRLSSSFSPIASHKNSWISICIRGCELHDDSIIENNWSRRWLTLIWFYPWSLQNSLNSLLPSLQSVFCKINFWSLHDLSLTISAGWLSRYLYPILFVLNSD